jgi:antitoxin (DNA-binding transcriptional repressor) of toxin-antitoxin stability system
MQVNLTEFSKDVPAYLKMVSTGKEVFIISQGKIIARVSPPSDAFSQVRKQKKKCSIAAAFEELRQLCIEENYQIEIPNRCTRENTFLGDSDEISL